MGLAAIYLRLSRNEEQLNIDEILLNHRNALTKLSKQHKLTYDIYQEISSGVNTERPQLNLLLSRLDDYDALLVMDIDRISRDNAHAEEIKKMLIVHDIKILTPQGAIDLSQESNEMLFSFQAMMANFEYKQIRKRLGRGRLAAAEQGKWTMSNRVPLGYKKNEEKRLEVVEDEAKIIRFIFQKTLERVSANEIAKQLDILGWRSRQGKVLTSAHISNMRKNVVYYGVVKACRKVNGRVVDDVFVENAHEPIVSKQMFLEVQKILEENANGNFFNKLKATRKLQNLIYCNCCKRKRYIQCDGNGVDYIKSCIYKVDNNKCRDRGYKYEPIEQFVLQKVKEKKPAFEQELQMLKSLDTTEVEKKLSMQRESLEKQINRFNKRQRNLKEMRMDGEITKAEFYEMRDENEEQIKQVKQQMELIDIKLENLSNTDEEQARLQDAIKKLDKLEELKAESCNTFLKKFIKKIWFSSNTEANHDTTRPREDATVEIEWL
ncbi:resolvase [Bacillus pseudomycoides]|uniref:recombinase family protein n=1 Tax=Bacillus pseudomycoides TaxID=64104 RepID=UPI000BEDE770|nr:recombinase family protein [Bacillus pseudomycoides]PDX99377.1 resolvase [Bacillus pseudomycoides]PEK83182.1 resolvase [Bacillus pseudomycoides]PEN09006.1 resolvase [Bacillus pseudomycoides]PGB88881.1 resolvase [Bacillus pseudomycoides]